MASYPPQPQRYPGPPGLLAFVPYNEQIDFQQFLLDFFGVWKKERNRQFYRARSYYRRSKFNSSSPQISFTTSYSINTYLVSPLRDFDESVKIQKIMKISSSSSSLSSTQIKRVKRAAVDLFPAVLQSELAPNSIPPITPPSTPSRSTPPAIVPPSSLRHAHPAPSNFSKSVDGISFSLYIEMLLECEAHSCLRDLKFPKEWSMDMFYREAPTFWRHQLFESTGAVLSPTTVARARELANIEMQKYTTHLITSPTTPSTADSAVSSNTFPERENRKRKKKR